MNKQLFEFQIPLLSKLPLKMEEIICFSNDPDMYDGKDWTPEDRKKKVAEATEAKKMAIKAIKLSNLAKAGKLDPEDIDYLLNLTIKLGALVYRLIHSHSEHSLALYKNRTKSRQKKAAQPIAAGNA